MNLIELFLKTFSFIFVFYSIYIFKSSFVLTELDFNVCARERDKMNINGIDILMRIRRKEIQILRRTENTLYICSL
jgi:hypothetical protein